MRDPILIQSGHDWRRGDSFVRPDSSKWLGGCSEGDRLQKRVTRYPLEEPPADFLIVQIVGGDAFPQRPE